ncbi:VOC family protein [Burkholderia glumae]|uniref:VOC family protein n=1 Tax=Burkholderia glumae TaxID=337 RepID=A0AAP9Y4D9_BURGL|nr:VOC family protein [Burkholderia glumae]ACR29363.1 glyoxalase family protein [Burkholderia glumae BGR1]AJY67741.1 glyoxalase/Bleomycin resistance /Dioxygenase superfamily protein [Burkholderia glumae LMG 2196 = ATCC 33617]KHJ60539.1 glyoxalase [Burkholderia glumae]MCM2493642.1 VOC family protein [Burkholderia glumae]MCM2543737.1 VOC family protein [Burkholderia glumae]
MQRSQPAAQSASPTQAQQGDPAGGAAPAAPALDYRAIDHIALAVVDLEAAVHLFTHVLGFRLMARRHIQGRKTGMRSAELESGGGLKFVLCQGTEPESQVSRLVSEFGPGVAHIALEVDDVARTVDELRRRGLGFDTSVIEGPGLTQSFSSRDRNTGLSFEFIKRNGEHGFVDDNIQSLFDQLERSDSY